jgi:hypothetical protein
METSSEPEIVRQIEGFFPGRDFYLEIRADSLTFPSA